MVQLFQQEKIDQILQQCLILQNQTKQLLASGDLKNYLSKLFELERIQKQYQISGVAW